MTVEIVATTLLIVLIGSCVISGIIVLGLAYELLFNLKESK